MAIHFVLMRDCSDMSYTNKVETITIYVYFHSVCFSY